MNTGQLIFKILISLDENNTMHIVTEGIPSDILYRLNQKQLIQRVKIAIDNAYITAQQYAEAMEIINEMRNPKSTENNHEII